MATVFTRMLDALNILSGGKALEHFRGAAMVVDDSERSQSEFRRITNTTRDMTPMSYDKAQKLSFAAWQRNPLAKRIIEILVDFCTGDDFAVNVRIKREVKGGPDVDTKREDGQKIWDDFAEHPVNKIYEDLPMFVQDLFLNGELLLPTAVTSVRPVDGGELGDGSVQIGYIDPANIREVVTRPKNIRVVESVILQDNAGNKFPVKVVNVDENPFSPTYGKRVGEALYWRVNRVVNQTRGHGELVELLDWLDALDQFLFDALMGFRVRNNFFWDVTVAGATQPQVDAYAKSVTPPQTGRVRVHNDKVTYEGKAPDLGSMEVEKALLSLQTFVVGTKGYPIMWFGSGAETNKATAGEMGVPTMRMLKAAQSNVKKFISYMAYYVLDQAQIAGTLKLAEGEYVDVQVNMFDFERADAAMLGAGFQQMVAALQGTVDNGWVSAETAKRVVDGLLMRMGVEPDESETVDQNLEDVNQRKAEDPYTQVGNAPAIGEDQDEEEPEDATQERRNR